MIIVLRFIRIYMSVVALAIGNRAVTPQDMVSFIQSRRRKLRAIRMHGMKVIGRRELDANASKSSGNDNSLVGKLSSLMSRAVCRPGQSVSDPARRVFVQHLSGKSQISGASVTETVSLVKQSDEKNFQILFYADYIFLIVSQMTDKI